MNPTLSAIKILPSLERVVASRYFSRYLIIGIVIALAIYMYHKNKTA